MSLEKITATLKLEKEGSLRVFLKRLSKNAKGLFGGILLFIVILVALLAPIIAPYDPNKISSEERLNPPNLTHFFGTDELGRDIFSRIVWGARISLFVGLISVTIALGGGLILGLLAGYYRRYVDEFISRIVDILLSFPAILLALLIVTVLGPSIPNIALTVGIIYMPQFARIVRAGALSVREKDFVQAAIAAGDGDLRIMIVEILPNTLAPLIVQSSITFAFAILTEAALSFLGLGVPPPHPAWGSMLYDARGYMEIAPWMTMFPGFAIFLTVLAFNMFGDGLRDILDPRLRID
ncbi:MAG: ABC transporter permease [Nitrososphaerales archaeon]